MTRNAFWGLCIGLCMAGTQAVAQKIESTSIKTDNKRDCTSFHIDGITDGESLFTAIGGPDAPVVNAGMPGTEGIQGGLEGGLAPMLFTGHANPLYWNQAVSMHWYMKTIP